MIADDVDATIVECPTCYAWVGWACTGRGYGYHAAGYHRARIQSARNHRRTMADNDITDLELMQLAADTFDRPLSLTHRAALELQRRRANDPTSYDRDSLRFAIHKLEESMVARDSTNDDKCRLAIMTIQRVLKQDATPIPRLTDDQKRALLCLQRSVSEFCDPSTNPRLHETVCRALDLVLTHG